MAGPTVRSTSVDGRRRLTDEHRERMRAAGRRFWETRTPEQRAEVLARLARSPMRAPREDPPPAPPPTGGPRNPLDDAPRARPVGDPSSEGRRSVAPPRFVVPDLPPLEPSAAGDDVAELEAIAGPEVAPAFPVDPELVTDVLTMPFDFVADRRGAHWKLRPAERERLAGAITRIINRHEVVARGLNMGGDWLLLGAGLALVINTRLAEDSRRAQSDQPSPTRPELAVVGGQSGAGGRAPAPGGRPGNGHVSMDEPAWGFGSLNGYRAPARADDPALAPEAAGGPPRQNL